MEIPDCHIDLDDNKNEVKPINDDHDSFRLINVIVPSKEYFYQFFRRYFHSVRSNSQRQSFQWICEIDSHCASSIIGRP